MLYAALDEGVVSQATALKYIGERLRTKAELPDWLSDEDVARHLLKYVRGRSGVQEREGRGGL